MSRPLVKKSNNPKKDADKDGEPKIYAPYIKSVLYTRVWLSITEIGSNLKRNLERMIVAKTEGKCLVEGFIRPNSVSVLAYSSGKIKGDQVEFMVTYQCSICHPVSGMIVECTCKTITKAGIHAIVEDVVGTKTINPVVIFVARDHHLNNYMFDNVKEGASLQVRVVGIRFELNDPHICAIGKLVDSSTEKTT